jgi:alpha-L-arabinofuranosidase
MERQIAEVSAVCDLVQGLKRSPKKLWLSFDEWNVWYRARSGAAMDGARHSAPHLLEEVYNLEDALLVGGLINSLIRNSERVRVGCLAQLVNVIAPLVTNANGLLRQTIFYPYSWALQFARGSAINVLVENPTTYAVAGMAKVPHLDVAGISNPADGSITMFVLNRDLSKPRQFEINWEDRSAGPLLNAMVLTGADLKAVNGFDTPQRVAPRAADKPSSQGARTTVEVPPRSYSVFQWGA